MLMAQAVANNKHRISTNPKLYKSYDNKCCKIYTELQETVFFKVDTIPCNTCATIQVNRQTEMF